MKPERNPRYLAWIRTQPCCVCGSKKTIEASHTGPHGIGQKSPDTSAIPLCAKHHRTGNDSYHRLGPRKFSEKHNLDIPAMVSRLSAKPVIRIEANFFVTYFDNCRYVLGKNGGRDSAGRARGSPAVPRSRWRSGCGGRPCARSDPLRQRPGPREPLQSSEDGRGEGCAVLSIRSHHQNQMTTTRSGIG